MRLLARTIPLIICSTIATHADEYGKATDWAGPLSYPLKTIYPGNQPVKVTRVYAAIATPEASEKDWCRDNRVDIGQPADAAGKECPAKITLRLIDKSDLPSIATVRCDAVRHYHGQDEVYDSVTDKYGFEPFGQPTKHDVIFWNRAKFSDIPFLKFSCRLLGLQAGD